MSANPLVRREEGLDFASVIESVRALKAAPPRGRPLNVHVHRNCTVDRLMPYLELELFAVGAQPHIRQGDYDTYMQDLVVTENGPEDQPDLSMVILYPEGFLVPADVGFDEARSSERLERLLELLSTRNETVVLSNLAAPAAMFVGVPSAVGRGLLQRLNQTILAFVDGTPHARMLDIEGMAARLGDASAFDSRGWYRFRAPHARALVRCMAEECATAVRDRTGHQKKCLVLDCDNTLWGGVVGECGLDEIELDPHEGRGRAYYDFQRQVLALQRSGVMVALLSKNNEEDVLEVIDRHPHCLLGREHLVGWKIDWNDKPGNMRALVGALNIGLDACVFIDDSDIEVALMRECCPEVTTLLAPSDRAQLPELLVGRPLFTPGIATAEDSNRTRMYRDAVLRDSERTRFDDLSGFLASLDMVAAAHELSAAEVDRVTQLLARTNQFTLTELRPDEARVRSWIASDDELCFTLSARDRFGELGLVGALVITLTEEGLRVDGLAMSCRALGRRLEDCLMHVGLSRALARTGGDCIRARYQPTAKNRQVSGLLERYGFTPVDPAPEGAAPDDTVFYIASRAEFSATIPNFVRVEHD